jgi:hypothetical protein
MSGAAPAVLLTLTLAPLGDLRPYVGVGQGVRCTIVTLNRSTAEPLAATGVSVIVGRPDTPVPVEYQTAQLTADGVGRWLLDLPSDAAGAWRVRAVCTGPRPAAREVAFWVTPSPLEPDEPPAALLVTSSGELIATPEGRLLTAAQVDRLGDLGVPADGDTFLAVRSNAAGNVSWGAMRAATAADRAAAETARAEAQNASGTAVLASQDASTARTQAEALRSQVEAAFAIASGGTAGFMQAAGGYLLATTIYAANGNQIVAGHDISGRLIVWTGTAYVPVGSTTQAQIEAALGFPPASAAALAGVAVAAGSTGFVQRAGGFLLARCVYDLSTGRILGGHDIYGRQVVFDGAGYGLVAPISQSSISAGLGYTPADAGDVTRLALAAGSTGFVQRAGDFLLTRCIHDQSTGRILGGHDIYGRQISWDGGDYVVGAGAGATGAAPAYVMDDLTGTVAVQDDDTILMVIGWGQSLALAQIGAVPGDVPFSTTAYDPTWSLMFDQGPVPEDRAISGFVPLRNTLSPEFPRPLETAGPQMFRVIQARLQARLGFKRRLLWSVVAAGGAQYEILKRGTLYYDRLVEMVERAVAIAKTEGRRVVVVGVWCRHGEADVFRTGGAYAADMLRFRPDLQEDLVPITGQSEPIRLFVTQPTRGGSVASECGTAVGLMQAADRDPMIRLMGPIYYAEHRVDDSAHPNAAGFARIGETQGHAMAEELFGPGYQPTRIEDAWWSAGGATPQLTLRYTRPVVIDTSGAIVPVTGVIAAGFDVTDVAGAVAIASVTAVPAVLTAVVAGNTLTLGPGTGGTLSIRTNGDLGPVGLSVTVDGQRYDLFCDIGDGLAECATALAALVPGASAAGYAVTFAGASVVTASVASTDILLTLAAAPGLRPRLHYATRTTAAIGSQVGLARGLVREWRRLGLSLTAGTPPLHHWACVEVRPLPRL